MLISAPLFISAVTPGQLHNACGTNPGWLCRHVLNLTGSQFLAGVTGWIVGAPLRIIGIVLGAFVLNRLGRRLIKRGLHRLHAGPMSERLGALARFGPHASDTTETSLRAEQRIDALTGVLRSVFSFVIMIIAGFMVLGQVGINLGPLLAGAGIAGVALGLGAQSLVRDFLTGMFILIEDQFGVGDVVDVGEASGTVEAVSLRVTRLRSVDGVVWHVPNGQIQRVGNKSQHWSRAVLDIEVAYDTDLAFARTVIKDVLDTAWKEDATILEEPSVWGVEELGASAITIRTVVKTQPSEQFAVSRMLRERMKVALDDAGIEIPFPTQTVWHRTEAVGASAPGRDD